MVEDEYFDYQLGIVISFMFPYDSVESDLKFCVRDSEE